MDQSSRNVPLTVTLWFDLLIWDLLQKLAIELEKNPCGFRNQKRYEKMLLIL